MLAVLTCLHGWPAEAQEYCVSCSEPNALYRCVIEGAQPRGGQSLQMLCVTAMAKDGGHATCSVKRGTVFECDGRGEARSLGRAECCRSATAKRPRLSPGLQKLRQPKPEPAASPVPSVAASRSRCATPGPEAPPQTVLELAKRTNEKTTEQMKEGGRHRQRGDQEDLGLHAVAVHPLLSGVAALSAAPATRAPGAGPRRSRSWTSRGRSPCGSAWRRRCRA